MVSLHPRFRYRRHAALWPACLALCVGLPSAGGAVCIGEMEVTERAGSYHTLVEAGLEAPAPAVWRALTDYSNYVRLSPSIRRVQRLGRGESGTERVRTWSEACVFGFCKQIRQVQELRQLAFGELRAQLLPGDDIASGQAAWSLAAEGQASRLRFEAEMKPAFWVPPLVGSWAIRRALEQELTTSLYNLERMARQLADP